MFQRFTEKRLILYIYMVKVSSTQLVKVLCYSIVQRFDISSSAKIQPNLLLANFIYLFFRIGAFSYPFGQKQVPNRVFRQQKKSFFDATSIVRKQQTAPSCRKKHRNDTKI